LYQQKKEHEKTNTQVFTDIFEFCSSFLQRDQPIRKRASSDVVYCFLLHHLLAKPHGYL